MSVSGKPS